DERAWKMIPAQFSQVQAGGDAKLRRKDLNQHRHQIAYYYNPKESVAQLCPALDICSEVSGIYVCDGGDKSGAKERKKPFVPGDSFLGQYPRSRRNRTGVKSARFVFGSIRQKSTSNIFHAKPRRR